MKFLGLVLAALLPNLSQSATVVVLKGSDSAFARRYFSGFSSMANEKISAFRYETGKDAALISQIKKVTPDLIFTIGASPIRKLAEAFPATPIISSPQLSEEGSTPRPNVVVMEREYSVTHSLLMTQSLFPTRKTIGAIYNPKYSKNSLDELITEASKFGLKVASLKVDSAQDVKALISALTGKMDLYYWLEDPTTSAKGVEQEILDFTSKNNIPIISPDPGLVERGALIAVATDPFRLGEAAWETAKRILVEKKIPTSAVQTEPGKGQEVYLSLNTASRSGIGSDALFAFFQRVLKDKYQISLLP